MQERETGNVKELGETSRWQWPRQINGLPEKRVSSCPCQVAAGEEGDASRGKVEEAENMSQQGGWQAGQPCHNLTTPATAAQRWRGGRDSSLFCGRDARAGAQPTPLASSPFEPRSVPWQPGGTRSGGGGNGGRSPECRGQERAREREVKMSIGKKTSRQNPSGRELASDSSPAVAAVVCFPRSFPA